MPGADEISKGAALIRRSFHVDPYALSDDDFARLLGEAIWLAEFDRKAMEAAFEIPLRKVVSELFGKKRR